MKRVFALIVLLNVANCSAQNLVPNPSFEDTVIGTSWGSFFNTTCADWRTILPGTADYFNDLSPACPNCASNFTQIPRTGSAYAGMYLLDSNWASGREPIEVVLIDTLTAGKRYCVSFYVSRLEGGNYACGSIGALFTSTSIGSSTNIFNFTPQVGNTSGVITNSQGWDLVSGEFIANGDEVFMTIGNFKSDVDTDTMVVGGGNIGWNFAYYLIDDVSVVECSDTIAIPANPVLEISNVFTPNGDGNNDMFVIRTMELQTFNCTIYDRWGAVLFETTNTATYWDGRNKSGQPCPDGTYFYVVEAVGTDNTIFSKRGFVTVIR